MGIRRIYKRGTPYPQSALGTVDYAQTADVLYTARLGYPQQKLERSGHTDWNWSTITFGPDVDAPTGASATATTPNTTDIHYEAYSYAITVITDGTDGPVQESRRSTGFSVSNDLSLAGNYNTINLPALGPGEEKFVIYKKQAGLYGYIGSTDESTFKDNNIIPVLSETPPEGYNPFTSTSKYPSVVGLHEQRLTYAASKLIINGVWMSRSADLENMDRSSPLRDDDSLQFGLLSDRVNNITNVLSMRDGLLVLSGDAIWVMKGVGDGGITASSISVERHSGRGASRVKPLLVDDIGFFVDFSQQQLHSINYSFEVDGYRGTNQSVFAPHLFRDTAIKRIQYQSVPSSVIWTLLEDGRLLAFTWEQAHDVWGWAEIETTGTFNDITVVSENGVDRLYAIIDRDGRRFLERLALPERLDEACHLDCAVTFVYETPTSTIDGLWHLEGQSVSAYYDEAAEHDLVVTNGTITLQEEVSRVSVGLRYTMRIETLPPALTGAQGSLHASRQQIGEMVVRTQYTKLIKIGVGQDVRLEQMENWPDGGNLHEDADVAQYDYRVTPPGAWEDETTVVIVQDEPFPAYIVGIFADLKISSR